MNRYYIDVTVRNKAGVLNRITSIFSRLSINIHSLSLYAADDGDFAKISFGYHIFGIAVKSDFARFFKRRKCFYDRCKLHAVVGCFPFAA